jgi:hypothetical protein
VLVLVLVLGAGSWELGARFGGLKFQVLVGAAFTFFNTLRSHPAVVLYVYLLPKSTIPNAQHDSGDIF